MLIQYQQAVGWLLLVSGILLLGYVLQQALYRLEDESGVVVYSEGTFVLVDTPNWVKGSRVPDIMVYNAARIAAYKSENANWRNAPFILVPDLCVEVVSENDKMNEVTDKVEAYLRDGVRLIWVIEPKTRTITIRELGSQQATILYPHDTLTGGAVMPGLSVRVYLPNRSMV